MEKWIEIFKGIIPNDTYTAEVKSGEEVGLIATLESKENVVTLDFGAVSSRGNVIRQ